MGKLFNTDGPIMSFLSTMADLVVLNVLTFICCIPIFTAGAAFTALHYVSLKIVREEEGYIIKDYFKSFKQNFKQATIVWLILLFFAGLLVGDYAIIKYMDIPMSKPVTVVLAVIGVVFLLTSVNIFPVLAKFENTVFGTIKNAALIGIGSLPITIMSLIGYALPVVGVVLLPAIVPIVLLLGISLPAYLSASFYSNVLKKFEPQEEIEEDNWCIHDMVEPEYQKEKKDEQ